MVGQRVGYIRVSTQEQNPDRQLDGIPLDRVFSDRASAKDTLRPGLQEMLTFIREGDVLIVHSMDRLARNLNDLRTLVLHLTKLGVRVEFIKEGLIFSGEDSPLAHLLLSVVGAFAEFERALLKERQKEGIILAKKRGVYRGRKKSLSPLQISDLLQRIQNGETKAALAREFNISRETLYQYLKNAA
jgi:DNA invertase Pin-like site-specific DNA recombinase